MTEVTIHVGAHKTGTSYIQQALSGLAEILKRDHGIIYPETGRETLWSEIGPQLLWAHHALQSKITSGEDVSEIRNRMRGETRGFDRILLSSENFEYLNRDKIQVLISLFDVASVKVIYFYRNWTPLLYSMWQEAIKHGRTFLYDQYCLKHIVVPTQSFILNYRMVIDQYADVVGLNNISIASYEALTANGDDVCRVLLRQIGAEAAFDKLDGSLKSKRVNEKFDSFLVEAVRVMNALAIKEGYENAYYLPRHHYIESFMRQDDGQQHNRLAHIMANHLAITQDYSQSVAAKQFFQAFLQRYAHRMIDDEAVRSRHVNRATTSNVSVVHQDYLLVPEAVSIVRSAWSVVKDKLRGL